MNIIIQTLLLILLMFLGNAALAANSELACRYHVTGLDSTLNIRAQPGTQYEVIGTIPPNADNLVHLKEIVSTHSNPSYRVKIGDTVWLYVRYAGINGWVSERYLTEGECAWTDDWEMFGVQSRPIARIPLSAECEEPPVPEIFLNYNYKSMKLSHEQCLSKAKQTLRDSGFKVNKPGKSTVVGVTAEGYKGSVWCTRRGLAFFVVAGADFPTAKKLEHALRAGF